EQALDRMLRAERFVDLYAVVRQGMLVGVERYSIKNLEPLYEFARAVPLLEANRCLRAMEHALEMNLPDAVPADVLAAVEGYNKDDCLSTLRLRDWLEQVRAQAETDGATMPRPTPQAADASENVGARSERVAALR